ncbi:hypothetical protein TNCV_5092951 [Trichonephila clavipes]|nr:hypothetical protein TNCV_5092951 [Trichonephila clavipes]
MRKTGWHKNARWTGFLKGRMTRIVECGGSQTRSVSNFVSGASVCDLKTVTDVSKCVRCYSKTSTKSTKGNILKRHNFPTKKSYGVCRHNVGWVLRPPPLLKRGLLLLKGTETKSLSLMSGYFENGFIMGYAALPITNYGFMAYR